MRTVVFSTADIGYWFYVDGTTDRLSYRKTTDGGASWGSAVELATSTTLGYDVWFDQWTPGDSGTLIHFWHFTSGDDDVLWRTLDTNGDTLGTQRVVFAGATFVAGRGVFVSGTKTRSGYLYCAYDGDAGAERGLHRSTDGGTTWSSNLSTTFVEATIDQCLLFPASNTGDNNDCWAVYHDADADAVTLKMWDSSGATATESTTIVSLTENTTDLTGQYGFSGSVRHSDGHLIVATVTERDTSTADHRVWDLNGTGSITELTAITTNIDDHYHPAVFIDQLTDDIYVAFNGLRDGSQTLGTSTKVYYTTSADSGSSWTSGSTTYMEGTAGVVVQVWAPLMGPRFYVGWRVGTTLNGNNVNSLTFSSGFTGSGSLTVTTPTIAATGAETYSSTGALTVTKPTLSGSALEIENVSGSGALTVTKPTLAGTGAETYAGSGALTVTKPVFSGNGTQFFNVSATGALSVTNPSLSGTGFIDVAITATGALTVPSPAVAGTGAETYAGSGAMNVTAPSLGGAGSEIYAATGALGITTVVSGTGALVFSGGGALLVPTPVFAGGFIPSPAPAILTHFLSVSLPSSSHYARVSIPRRHGSSVMDLYSMANGDDEEGLAGDLKNLAMAPVGS